MMRFAVACALVFAAAPRSTAAGPAPTVGEHRIILSRCATITAVDGDTIHFSRSDGATGRASRNLVGAACQPAVAAPTPARHPAPKVGESRLIDGLCVTITKVTEGGYHFVMQGGSGQASGGFGAPCKGTPIDAAATPPRDLRSAPAKQPQPMSCRERCEPKACRATLVKERHACLARARSLRRDKRAVASNACSHGFNQKLKAQCAAAQATCVSTCLERTPQKRTGHPKALVEAHNRLRADVGVAPLEWSNAIAAYAQSWAEYLARSSSCKRLRHRSGPTQQGKRYGENLAAFWSPPGQHQRLAKGVTMWGDEKKYYRPGTPYTAAAAKAGHYTQIVWRETHLVGCGWTSCGPLVVLVCNYDPPGNLLGAKVY